MQPVNSKDIKFILSIEQNHILCSQGDYILAYKIEYPEKYSQSEKDFECLQAEWHKALHHLPSGTIILKSDLYERKKFDSGRLPQHTFIQKATANYFHNREYMAHTGYLFFIMPALDTLKNERIKNPFILPKLKQIHAEEYRLQAFINNVEEATELLKQNSYLTLYPLEEREILQLQQFYFNAFHRDYLTDVEIKKEHIEADDHLVGIFALTNEKYFPEQISTAIEDKNFSSPADGFVFYQGIMDDFGLTLNCNHIYNQLIILDNHRYHAQNLHHHLKEFRGTQKYNPENETYTKRLEAYEQDNMDNPFVHYVRGHNNIIFWSDTRQEFDHYKKKISTLLKQHDFIPYYATKEQLKNLYYNSYFTNVSNLNNHNLYVTDLSVCTSLFINNTNYHQDETGIYLNDRVFNIPVIYDLWDYHKKVIKSRNFMVIAPTGRGKSFTLNHITRQFNDQGIINITIDLGDSHIKSAKLQNPDEVAIFKYKEGESSGLDMFVLDDNIPSALKLEEICNFVWTLIKKREKPTELEQTSLRKIVTYYYDIIPDGHCWENFYEFIELNSSHLYEQLDIENKEFFKIDEFLHAGSDFVKEGIYASMFRGQDKSFQLKGKKKIIFELGEIQDNVLLLTLTLPVIFEAIQRTILSDRTQKAVIIIDEAAKQLKFPDFFSKIEYYTQAIRKYNSAIGLVFQTLSQLPETPGGNAIIENTETFIFLQADSYTSAIKRLELSEHDISQLNSLQAKFEGKNPYSEIYIWRKNRKNVYRLEVPYEVFLAYQTEGEIHAELMELYRQHGDMEIAIQTYIQQHPKV